MLTDTKLKNLKPQGKIYKVTDRDGLYVAVLTSGTVSFRYDYRINGRRETLTIGKYGPDGITLAEAREALIAAKKTLNAGQSPAAAKRDGINKIRGTESFKVHTDRYMAYTSLADSTRAMKQSVIDRDVLPVLGNKLMTEINAGMVRDLCDRLVDRGGRATAVQVREIINSVYRHANDRGYGFVNPAADIKPSSIAVFKPRERMFKPEEIGIFFRTMDTVGSTDIIKMAVRLIMLTLVRKAEFTNATWGEIDFRKWTWTIPAGRMKAGREHVVYLSRQAQDLIIGLQMCSGGSEFIVPGRYTLVKPVSGSALNRIIKATISAANAAGYKLSDFSVHDIRRTGSTLLHEAGFPSDWIEKALAHEHGGVRAVYNRAEYADGRTYMLQQWADMVDAWIAGEHTDLVPFSPLKFEKWMEGK